MDGTLFSIYSLFLWVFSLGVKSFNCFHLDNKFCGNFLTNEKKKNTKKLIKIKSTFNSFTLDMPQMDGEICLALDKIKSIIMCQSLGGKGLHCKSMCEDLSQKLEIIITFNQ